MKEVLDELLAEAFAVCREASWRVLNMRHFDVQLIGGMVLHQGKIAEMKTGEGKTLVATLPVYLNALSGRGVHVVTVNDYLAKRDSEWMGKLYSFLGLTVGVIVHDLDDEERREAYAADVTYGTNNEFGFDYLRDNMKFDLKDCVQRGHNYAHRRRSGFDPDRRGADAADHQRGERRVDRQVRPREPHHPEAGERRRNRRSTGRAKDLHRRLRGRREAQEHHGHRRRLGEGREAAGHRQHRRSGELGPEAPRRNGGEGACAVPARCRVRGESKDDTGEKEVIIVDEFTGRMMPGRRWSDGLHQAIEAKENVKIERENQTLATITFQNYFRMYKKLAGMTGTAETEAPEFDKIYKLEVVVIPTNKTLLRKENPDVVYRTEKEKYFAAADEIQQLIRKRAAGAGGYYVDRKIGATCRNC